MAARTAVAFFAPATATSPVYVTSSRLKVFALKADTGESGGSTQRGTTNRGVAYWTGRVNKRIGASLDLKNGLGLEGTVHMPGILGGATWSGASFDADTNKGDPLQLWEFQLPAGGYALPATYSVNGKQYVVISAGGGGKFATKAGDAYMTFALPWAAPVK